MLDYITDDTEMSSDDSDRKDCNDENSDKQNLMKKILMKKIKYSIECVFYV